MVDSSKKSMQSSGQSTGGAADVSEKKRLETGLSAGIGW
jgi:hypothetical protein